MNLLLNFMIKVIEPMSISFPSEVNNPLETARLFLKGDLSAKEYDQACNLCWEYIDNRNAIRIFNEEDILLARLGISLLSANKDLHEAGEKLDWFFQVLDYLNVDTSCAEELMTNYFSFRSDPNHLG
ncbi:hypothetical protein GTG28_07615 [Vibrio sp. OCN044]|uniref:Uncharacterized protein n=1 Tax=Vibrio tetraodonis subsp. pristinus TaxID=2695891 RepID=A0A6L8LSU1_9VIBR|nr:hypothetical protein [Vibrio tetraodonis]MYM59087.1 hypothetical protein [Vibrio tetraodonis subsp. pristinus]